MGRVTTEVLLENIFDLGLATANQLSDDKVRRLQVPDALVDTGASTLGLPKKMIASLGLTKFKEREVMSASGISKVGFYSAVRMTIQGRDCTCDVMELEDHCPVLIGQIPLQLLDFVVDPNQHRLIGNPAHGGQHIMELYWRREIMPPGV